MSSIDIENIKLTKLYYSIGEVANMLNVNASLIRFWEKEFEVIKPKKNKKGNRQFTKEDVKNYKIIYYLVKERGYTLKGAKDKMKNNLNDIQTQKMIIDRMNKIKSFLLDIKSHL